MTSQFLRHPVVLRHELLFSYYFTPILRPARYWSIQTSEIPEAVRGPVNRSIEGP